MIRCEFCGKQVKVPDNWPYDWAVCKDCASQGEADERSE